ncbi:hypothetical protein IFM89_002044, partial [Coptis chinensis]
TCCANKKVTFHWYKVLKSKWIYIQHHGIFLKFIFPLVFCAVAADGNEPVQMKLYKSLRLWAFYVDLEEGLGTLESTRAVYERILDLKIATPQVIINYALLLEENKYFEDAFKVYERGVKIFKYPHVKDIWVTYLTKFVKRYGKTKLERARELFQHAVETVCSSLILLIIKLLSLYAPSL